ncbi:unnamed protein product [Clavelina lepadiformis]|uniref:Major facilitator superfamily (MFS) profile domain-containing protein n=1 Tax=Clavelina lepadiformis TaxID=159417 RepID=A0ABP0GHE2_CLALP
MDFEEFQKEIGGLSHYQFVVVLAVGWLSFGAGFGTQSAVFISAIPSFRCAVPPIDDPDVYPNLTESKIKNYTIPYDSTRDEYDSCNRYDYNLSSCQGDGDLSCVTSDEDPGTISCDQGYYYDPTYYEKTTITQWDLVCERQYLDSLANMFFFFGFFVGSLFIGPLSDWFGRKTAMLVTCVGMVASCIGCAFTPTYELFVFVRVINGAFIITAFIASYTYAIEISSTKWRTEAGAYICVAVSVAHVVFPGIAYAFNGDWRSTQLLIALVPAPFVLIYFFIPESPRWLLRSGRTKEARKIFARYAESRGKELTEETWTLLVQHQNEEKNKEESDKKKFAVWDLYRRPIMRLMSINVLICWFTVSMVFYGLALNGGNLAGDPYVNNTLNGVVEVVAYAFIYFAKYGRRPLLSVSFTLAGTCCIVSMILDLYSKGNQSMLAGSTAMALIGKLFASLSFGLIYSVTSEIFPTNVRTTALSMGSLAARVGGMASPFILQLQATIPWLTQTVFGSLSVICGGLTLFYPETVSTEYMTTLDQAENFYRENVPILKWLNKRKTAVDDNTLITKKKMSSKTDLDMNGKKNYAYETDVAFKASGTMF